MEVFFSSGKLGHVHTPSANWLALLDVAGAPLARQAIFPLVGEERLRHEPKERLGMSFGGQFIYLFIYLNLIANKKGKSYASIKESMTPCGNRSLDTVEPAVSYHPKCQDLAVARSR